MLDAGFKCSQPVLAVSKGRWQVYEHTVILFRVSLISGALGLWGASKAGKPSGHRQKCYLSRGPRDPRFVFSDYFLPQNARVNDMVLLGEA